MIAVLLLAGGAAARAAQSSETEDAVRSKLLAAYGGRNLMARPKASKAHDRVTIVINEKTTARNEATTELERESSMAWALSKWFTVDVDKEGNLVAKPRTGDKKPNLDFTATREHSGEGETERMGTFRSELSGEVIEVLPNGQLVVEARSAVKVNDEEQVVVFTGRVDPADLDVNNSVESKRIIDKRIRFTGTGSISRMGKRGWGARILDAINPF